MSSEQTTQVSLGDLLKVSSLRSPEEFVETYSVSENLGLVPQSMLFNKKVALEDRAKYKIVRPGEIAYNPFLLWAGAAGANLTDKDVAVSPAYIVLAPKSREEALYWHHLFRSASFGRRVSGLARGTVTRRRVAPVRDILEMSLDIPTENYRKRAASILQLLDDRAELLQSTNITLEAIAQALFKSWFVDFDPVRAKAEGREPEGMDAATAALFPSELQELEMEPVPAGWNTGTLADLSDLNSSKWNARNHPVSVRYIDLGGVRNNRIDPPSELPFSEAPSRARHHLREGDTIVGTVRPGNRAFAYIHQPEKNLTGSTGFAVLSPRSPEACSFVYLAGTSDLAIERLANLADGAAYPAVRPAVVSDTPCVIPPENVMKAFSGLTKPLLERIAQNNFTVHALANLRDTLLPRLISGKLCLPAVDNDNGPSEA